MPTVVRIFPKFSVQIQNALVPCLGKYELMAVDKYVWPNQAKKKEKTE
jgi:hypothetical protein